MRKSTKEGILQKYITQEEGVKLLLEIHSGSCGNHAASRNLAVRLLQILDLATQAGHLLQEALIPLEIMLGEALVEFVDNEFGFRIHDSQWMLATGEIIVGKVLGGIHTVCTPQII
jgi:hypothetical protein